MDFEWDGTKARQNHMKHGILFETAVLAFEDPDAVILPDRVIEGEERWHLIGIIPAGSVLVVVHTIREQRRGEEIIRIVSARKSTSRERRLYGNNKAH
jgi:uncharacterized DUF497 family protein